MEKITVMSWNVQAHEAKNKFIKKEHENETENEKKTRYTEIVEQIKTQDSDIVLLQEVDNVLFESLKIIINYDVFSAFDCLDNNNTVCSDSKSVLSPKPEKMYITAVLVKKDRFTEPYVEYVVSTKKNTYAGKNATIVHLFYQEKLISVVSIHLPGSNIDASQALFNAVIKKIKKNNAIIGGDFNCDPNKSACLTFEKFIDSNANQYGDKYTVCDFDYEPKGKAFIDTILFSDIFTKEYFDVLTKENCIYPSDHFPVVGSFSLKDKKKGGKRKTKKTWRKYKKTKKR